MKTDQGQAGVQHEHGILYDPYNDTTELRTDTVITLPDGRTLHAGRTFRPIPDSMKTIASTVLNQALSDIFCLLCFDSRSSPPSPPAPGLLGALGAPPYLA